MADGSRRSAMSSPGPARQSSDLADMVEMLLDKGVVINADIAVSVGDTQLLGIHLRAALASFETAAQYGLAFPEGTDEERIAEITGAQRHGPIGATGTDDDETAADLDAPNDDGRTERSAVAVRPSASRPGAPGPDDEAESKGGSDDEAAAETAPVATTDESTDEQTDAAGGDS
jgi:hypothetical protein